MQALRFHGFTAFTLLASALFCYAVGAPWAMGGALVLGGAFEAGFWLALTRSAARSDAQSRAGRLDRCRDALRRFCPRRSAASGDAAG